jgi:hypothetical protein
MISRKKGVTWEGVEPEVMVGLAIVYSIFKKHGIDMLTVTSTRYDFSGHMKGSKHYEGQAIDIRSNNLTEDVKLGILHDASMMLFNLYKRDYDFILESIGKKTEHFHLEFDPKNKKV